MTETAQYADVLVVDDDTGLLQLMSMRLKALGYSNRQVTSGEEALVEIRRKPPAVVISDLRMEEMDGLGLLDQIQKQHPGLPVIMLTAHGSIRDAVVATQKGAFAFLTKPVDREELRATLEKAVASQKGVESAGSGLPGFITRSSKMFQILEQARLVAQSDVNVMIQGESGTGKEVLAKAIHEFSARHSKPFIAINCGAIPEELLESELFGHVKGAFTGASRDHKGLFLAAEGGTLFLDEIGDMPIHLQVKLLRVLQERQIKPVGSTEYVDVNIRVISATHKNLLEMIEENCFREDLYYRLNVVNFELPALRERREDVPLLLNHFLEQLGQRYNQSAKRVAPEALECLLAYPWPGNVRELMNFSEKCHALSASQVISRELVSQTLPQKQKVQDTQVSLSEAKRRFEREYVERLLNQASGSIPEAARLADRNRSDFFKIVKKHGIDPELYKNKSDVS
ncbi:two-component system response regulator GlrR [Hahella sp. CCB-MM4]|uniref:sigma 54-interacting transcriptional regulator n=1 Tax=Hahella sp. (strain CCB-MM4) TaxID=1926491 RepID=UPI000B9BAEEE|nr:sigma 54-interacting transcriptional regulator [Hahella sp. CCB-MM4]OZG73201.1 two-component system response regulator GlrR [Hahella sp. CCB-MM4]